MPWIGRRNQPLPGIAAVIFTILAEPEIRVDG
jgi:hypothetical protein